MAWLIDPFVYLSLIGLVLSIIAHVCGLFGLPQPLGNATWMLHFGIFVVMIPTIAFGQGQKNSPNQDLSGCPAWFRGLIGVFGFYAMFNFATFLIMMALLEPFNRSDPTDAERHSALVFRGFSGHWMVFYAAIAGSLESALVQSKQNQSAPSPPTTDESL